MMHKITGWSVAAVAILFAGAGDDVLIIDGDDKAENIHGGVVQRYCAVVGNKV
ncbi:hypothetical protein INT80_11425 [Gallibacterium anatis]|uniref:Uncharacterized protein n=1 Tax=Gallibacterium anatis TaxID=750 RepID=A0A930US00_9PAST|nr:hypothetical protein [Gallibacterium anatis]